MVRHGGRAMSDVRGWRQASADTAADGVADGVADDGLPGLVALLGESGDLAARPTVDLRVVPLTVAGGALHVALDRDGDRPHLPRGVPTPHDPLDVAARGIARRVLGLHEQYLEQLYTLSVQELPHWTVIVSYMALISSGRSLTPPDGAHWHDVAHLPPIVPADRMVIAYALTRLRAKLGYTDIAYALLPETFTLTELQGAYETILAGRLDKRNFRRRVIASGILAPTENKLRDGSHRPAALYRFRPEHDRESYLTPPWAEGA